MIVTLTPNPSVDRTVFLDDIVLGSVNRSRRSWSEPSGKGVNVALALHAHAPDERVRAIVTAGGSVGAQLRQMLDTAALDTVFVPVAGDVRANISLIQPDGTVTKVNEAGPTLTDLEVRRLTTAVTTGIGGASLLVCGGSLPAGTPIDFYARVTEEAARQGIPVVVDSSGAPLAAGLTAGPRLIKPNTHELADLTGATLHTLGDVIDAAQQVRAQGAGAVLASLGADGAILVDADGVLYGRAPVDRVVSTVGAGDAMLSGFLAARADRATALATALEWGAAAVQHEGTLFSPPAVPQVHVTVTADVDRTALLRDDEPAPTHRRLPAGA